MKPTKKNEFRSNGFLSLLSVVSLVILFMGACAAVLAIAYRGEADFSGSSSRTYAETTKATFSPPQNLPGDAGYGTADGVENVKNLLSQFPYHAEFSAEFYITYVYEGYNVEFCRLYKSGEKYRIEIYNINNTLVRLVVCDGKGVFVRDSEGNEHRYALTREFSFASQAPLPTFLFAQSEDYVLRNYAEKSGVCTITAEYKGMGIFDIVEFDMRDGALKNAQTYLGTEVVMFYDIRSFESSPALEDSLFTVTSGRQQQ